MNEYTKGLKKIGQGMFTKCYEDEDGDNVILLSTDVIKECFALWGSKEWEPNDLFLPIERLDYLDSGEMVYRQRKIATGRDVKLRDLKDWHVDLIRWLRINMPTVPQNPYDGYIELYRLFESMPGQFTRYQEQLFDALDDASNTGSDIWMELTPRNLGRIDDNLILLDVFFNIGAVNKTRTSKKRVF